MWSCEARRPGKILIEKKENGCLIVDIAFPDVRVREKELENENNNYDNNDNNNNSESKRKKWLQ